MALLMHAALPRIVPAAFSSFSVENKEHKHYSTFLFIRSRKVSSPVLLPPVKASQTAFDIMRIISEKDDREIQAKLIKVENSCKKFKGILGDIILVLMATNPLLQCLSDALDSNNHFLRWSSIGASYGALAVLKEFAKVLCNSQPIWGLIILGSLIYKANMCNIALYRKGRHPIWLGPLSVLLLVKAFADFSLTLWTCKLASPLNLIGAFVEIMTSFVMIGILSTDDSILDRKAACADDSLVSVPRRRMPKRKRKYISCRVYSNNIVE